MKRTTALAALAIATIAFAGCSPATSETETTKPDPTTQSETPAVGVPMDGPAVEENEEETPVQTQFPMGGVTGTDENTGTTYTLSEMQEFPKETTDVIREAGVLFEEGVTVEGLRMVCVEIDNTHGMQEATINGLTMVTPDGHQHEFRTMDDYLWEMTETYDYEANYAGYELLFAEYEEYAAMRRAAPTATAKACFPINPVLEGEEFTYIGVDDGFVPVPLYPQN